MSDFTNETNGTNGQNEINGTEAQSLNASAQTGASAELSAQAQAGGQPQEGAQAQAAPEALQAQIPSPQEPASQSGGSSRGAPSKAKEKPKASAGKTAFIVVMVLAALCAYRALYKESGGRAAEASAKAKARGEALSVLTHKKSSAASAVGAFDHDYIARIDIVGTIQERGESYNQQWLLDTVEELKEDVKNRAILLYIDSPGGAVYQADELYLALLEYKKAGKAIWAYMGSTAASGGYYLACAADNIIANRNTLTGSIGVLYGPAIDLTGLMEKYGIVARTFTSGKNKNMLNYNQPITEEQAEIMQALVNECYDQFAEIVAQSRKLSLPRVREIADGRVYTAKQALDVKLIDKICGYDEAVEEMKTSLVDGKTLALELIEYEPDKSWMDYFTDYLGYTFKGKAKGDPAAMLLEKLDEMPSGLLYYCPDFQF